MNLELLASWGEFIGGMAVLITLIFLSYQVRQARHQINRETARARLDRSREIMWLELQNSEVLNRNFKAFADYRSLSIEDKYAFSNYMLNWISAWEQASIDEKYGDLPEGSGSGELGGIGMRLRTPGGKYWWERVGKKSFKKTTVNLIDAAISKSDLDFYDFHG